MVNNEKNLSKYQRRILLKLKNNIRGSRLEHDINNSKVSEHQVLSLIRTIQRVTQGPLRLFRWLDVYLYKMCSWKESLADLRVIYMVYS